MPVNPHNPFPILEGEHGNVPEATGRSRWVEDTYGERAWVKDDAPVKHEFIGLAATGGRLLIFFGALFFGILVLFGRVTYLVAQSDVYRLRSDRNRLRVLLTPAVRGVVYDRDGQQLVMNIPDLKLTVTPSDFPHEEIEREADIGRISEIVGIDPQEIAATLVGFGSRSYEPVTVAENISREQAVRLTILGSDVPGIAITAGSHRQYEETSVIQSLSHILGYMGKVSRDELNATGDRFAPSWSIGKTGLEYSYEDLLRGRPGVREVEVDALGGEVHTVTREEPQAGGHLRLTIDTALQGASEQALARALRALGLRRGAVIVEDVRNGELLSVVSLPAYANNSFAQGIERDAFRLLADDADQPLYPRAVSGTYPSGSTVKLVVAAAALDEGIVTPETTIRSTGGILYANRYWFPDWKAGGHGATDVIKAIAESVNTFFYLVGGGFESFNGLGIERLVNHLAAFGIGKKLDIDLPYESGGLLPTPAWKKETKGEDWYIGDTYHLAIGQGDLLVTPLHVAAWTGAVANNGTLWRPHVVQATRGADAASEERIAPRALSLRVAAPEALEVVRRGMREAVVTGSAREMGDVGMAVAGKTGTAQWNEKRKNHAWFTGFAPYRDPQIAVTVLIEEGGEGSSAALPVARDIFYWWAKNKLHPQD